MTEPRDSTAAGYVPISCDPHSEYELAILRRQWLCLVWVDNNVNHDQVVLPLNLKTAHHEEYLVCRAKDDTTREIRLDCVRRMEAAA
jgi:transcriptional antiterminator Rof (Rho-off)